MELEGYSDGTDSSPSTIPFVGLFIPFILVPLAKPLSSDPLNVFRYKTCRSALLTRENGM
ncbi:hypothetical protein BDV29DRAFT_175719 [Aspergillus leporis]|uniref:Uncharacterized protein n=1 Tax=Aspergillus leporis TaxID=41062 RepID=A0A5N5X204_9EURO|nr:hypothetical protein BDV29DRAFT_175719 [Aspergillus leporis]